MTSRRQFLRLSVVGTGLTLLGRDLRTRSRAAALSLGDTFRNRWPFNSSRNAATTVLKVVSKPLTVNGRTVTRGSIQQADGTFGYVVTRDQGVDVEIVNTLEVPTTIHWHGLYIPNLQAVSYTHLMLPTKRIV